MKLLLPILLCTLLPLSHSSITRRILHQPLFPESTSPPPPSDQPNGAPPPSPNTSSSPPPPTRDKELAISISVCIVTLGMLSALAFFVYKHKVLNPKPPILDSHINNNKLPDASSSSSNHTSPLDPITLVPNVKVITSVQQSDPPLYRPSPDLQPLPPLITSQAVAPASVTDDAGSPPATTELSSSEDEGSRDFHTPQGSISSFDDAPFSTPSSRFSHRTTIALPPNPPPPPPPPQLPQFNPILPIKMKSLTPKVPPPPPPPPPPLQSESQFRTPELKGELITQGIEDGERPKLKPLHWDKVRATSDRATVWDQLNSTSDSSSFQLNEDMMESLFGCNSNGSSGSKESTNRRSVLPPVEQQNRVLDPKKSQNIAILLRALNVTPDEVSDALLNGNPEALGAELLETLVKMAPTKEEEIKLKDYNGDSSKLGSAEKFLKAILDIPFAFRRVEAMLYRANFDAEVKYLRNSFDTLETASGELKNSKLFLKLLEAVLRTGNRMNVGTNRGDAKSFKLDTLLKLADIKGTDGKTTLLHFVVQEIIKSEGTESEAATNSRGKENEFRRQGLQMVSGLSRELGSVKLAAGMDSDVLHGYVSKLETGFDKVKTVLKLEREDMEGGFFESMEAFLGKAEEEISRIKEDERKALKIVRDVTEYFHGNAAKEEAHPFRIFMIVSDFLSALDHVCKDVGRMQDRTVMGAATTFSISTNASLPVLNRYKSSRGEHLSEESSSS